MSVKQQLESHGVIKVHKETKPKGSCHHFYIMFIKERKKLEDPGWGLLRSHATHWKNG